MQGLAKQSRYIMMSDHTRELLSKFGNFLFKSHNVKVFTSDGRQTEHLREISHADIENWKTEDDLNDHTLYPSRYAIDQFVWLRLWGSDIAAQIHGVHFYAGKVKYDLKLIGGDGDTTRVYNVDSVFVKDKIPAIK